MRESSVSLGASLRIHRFVQLDIIEHAVQSCVYSLWGLLLSFTLKNRSDLYPVPSLSYSSRQRNEFPWLQLLKSTQNEVQKIAEKDPEKVPTLVIKRKI